MRRRAETAIGPVPAWYPLATAAALRERFGALVTREEQRSVGRWCDWADEVLARPYPVPLVLVHGDLHGDNQIWSAAELRVVLDFENAGLGEPEYELRGFPGPGMGPGVELAAFARVRHASSPAVRSRVIGTERRAPGSAPDRREDLVEKAPEDQLADPPATWQEHWFDHRQLLRLHHSDEHCAIYLDPDVRRAEVSWLPRFINVTWQYSKATYGDAFGPDPRIYSVHHAGRHGGGHAGYYISPVHDHHNVSDCGLDTWREGNTLARELPAHEIGHSVESANNGAHGSPAYEVWGDSKWAEFYIYDLYTALGMDREAAGVYRRFTGNTDDFPRRGTRWFRDWFYPLWRDCGQAQVMNRFFRELARHFPRDSGGSYTRRMNWGEYVHFTSGAAAADLSGQAARAFGWPREWASQLEHAREQFPGITY